ncbi:SDR family oxidoreductase [Gordonia sp. VNK21]|uniref:SDR family oxidoreductase n=1 Tax=Gordonia sp. VNK21 TaxID=3382483 RepID=UPI0038D3B7C8
MRVVVLGASGQMGRELVAALAGRGVDVVAAHRSAGVDAVTGHGLDEAVAGADVVVDCLNVATQSGKKAIGFFGGCARTVSAAVEKAGVPRLVCLSIINAADPEVNAKFGYYQGKAEQERVYRELIGDRLTVVRSSQWYELAGQLMQQLRLGPVALAPHMLSQPCAAADAAQVLADAVLTPSGDVEVAGPQQLDLCDLAKQIAARDGAPRRVFGIRVGGAAIRGGGLLPRGDVITTSTTAQEWLAAR